MRTLITDPLIPGTLWATLAVLSLAAVGAYLSVRPPRVSRRRRAAIGGLLAAGLAGILAVLLNPTWEELRHSQLGRPTLDVLIDASASMATDDGQGQSRLDAAREVARALAKDLAGDFDVRLWRFDRDLMPLAAGEMDALEARGDATDLGRSLSRALAAAPGEEATLVVLSDGIHNVPDSLNLVAKAGQTARAMGVPIFTKTLGTDAVLADLALQLATPDDVAFVRQSVPIRVMVAAQGVKPGTSAEVTLKAQGGAVLSRTAVFTGEGPASVEFPVAHDSAGLYRYVAAVTPLPQETVRANNARTFHLRVIDEPIRVLVLEGKPYWDFKFLLRELAGDPGVAVTGAVRLADGRTIVRHLERTAGDTVPAGDERLTILTGSAASLVESYEQLQAYHVLVLGRDAQVFLTTRGLEAVCRWMGDWGGALVCGRGRPLAIVPTQLQGALPVTWEIGPETRFRVALSDEAQLLGWLPRASRLMPSLSTGVHAVTEKPLATVLARAEALGPAAGMAVVTYQPYGAGRSVVIEGSGLWRWAFLPPAADAHRDLYPRFWNSLLRWLVASSDFLPGETAALHTNRVVYTTVEQVVIHLSVRDDPEVRPDAAPTVEIQPLTPAGKSEDNTGEASPAGDHASGMLSLDFRRAVALVPAGGAHRRPSAGQAQVGTFRGACDPLPAGSYVVRLPRHGGHAPVQCAFEVHEPVEERLDLRARRGLMDRLATEAGGAPLTDDPAGQVRAAYSAYWRARHPEEFHRTPAWDRLVVLLALAALLAGLWVVRRRGGLV